MFVHSWHQVPMHSDCFAFGVAAFGNKVDGVKSPTCCGLIFQIPAERESLKSIKIANMTSLTLVTAFAANLHLGCDGCEAEKAVKAVES